MRQEDATHMDRKEIGPYWRLEDLKEDSRFILRISFVTQWIVGLEDPTGGGAHCVGKSPSLTLAIRKSHEKWKKL